VRHRTERGPRPAARDSERRLPKRPQMRRLTALLCLVAAACSLPHDSDGTLDHIARDHVVRVGVVENSPWVNDSNATVEGIEGMLASELARGLGARAVWVRGPESRLLAAVQHRELDLVIGGLTDDLPWTSVLALTRPYYTDTIEVGLPPGSAPRDLAHAGIKGDTVAVDVGDRTARDVRDHRGIPLPIEDLARAPGLVAAPTWRLALLGRRGSGLVLHEAHHVLALSPGENAWLVHVERFLEPRRPAVAAALRRAHVVPAGSTPAPLMVPHA
jgi:polar amino acid transport system substrate-binding protein